MTNVLKQDLKIRVNFKRPDGERETVLLEEFDSLGYIQDIVEISKRVTIQDTADVIFRTFAKAKNNEANLADVSKKLPCLKGKNLEVFTNIFNRHEMAQALDEYNTTNDKIQKRNIRANISKILMPEIEKNVPYEDLYFNFSKFKFIYPDNPKGMKEKLKKAAITLEAKMFGLDTKDKFAMAVFQLYKDNVIKRSEEPRQAHWLLIKDLQGKVIGMTFISSKEIQDKLTHKNTIGHSGQILDPSVQGKGYVSVIKSVMVDFMYDNMDKETAKNALFATTCNELNENSQGLQYKSGAKPLVDKEGNIIIDSGKMYWHASKEEIMSSEIMKQCIERGVSYEVMPAVKSNGRFAYSKLLGQASRTPLNINMIKGTEYDM